MLGKFERKSFRDKNIRDRNTGIKRGGEGQKELPSLSHREKKSEEAVSNFELSEKLKKKTEEIEKRRKQGEGGGLIDLAERRVREALRDAEKQGRKNLEDYSNEQAV